MRKELEQIEKIEQYLNGQMTGAERSEFEQQIANDPALQEEVTLQQEVMTGIQRAALKQQARQAAIRFKRGRGFTRWGLSGLCVVAILAAIFYFNGKSAAHPEQSIQGSSLPNNNEQGGRDWADADRNLRAQVFVLNAGRDTVVETKGGIVLSVPANGLLDEKGQPVKGTVQLTIKEALDPAAIMKAGLASRSGNRLLESGGMFLVDARKDGKILKIDPSNGIYAQVPADNIKPGMQLFTGKRMSDGSIDWINPRPLEHDLIPVDIHLLDFYPPHYLDSLAKWGYDVRNKAFTDSLYFSLASIFQQNRFGPEDEKLDTFIGKPDGPGRYGDTTAASPARNSDAAPCGINPAKIKTIWSREFQNTLLSTREFEQRIPWIHRSAQNNILDLYVNNLDKNLSEIDSLAARQLSGSLKKQFLSFAARHDGKIKNGVRQFDKLREYYERKASAYTEAISKTENDFWSRQAELDNQAQGKQIEYSRDSGRRIDQLIREEFSLSLKEALRQLGYDTTIRPWPPGTQVYSVRILTTGWCNIDRYVEESVVNRTTLDFTDSNTGKKAIINYLPVSLQVEQAMTFDRLYVYLLPDKLSSFMRLNGVDGNYSDRLNQQLHYKLVCIGYKDEQAFFYSHEDIQPGNYTHILLTGIGRNELDGELNKTGNQTQAAALAKENSFFLFAIRDQKRQINNQALRQLRNKVERLIFPCEVFFAETIIGPVEREPATEAQPQ